MKESVQNRKQQNIVDAVNYFKAENPCSDEFFTIWRVPFGSGLAKGSTVTHRTVCLKGQFDKCVKELSEAAWMTGGQHSDDAVEWKNGDECVWDGNYAIFVGQSSCSEKMAVIEFHEDNSELPNVITDRVWLKDISKPETPEQKAARVREENAKALYKIEARVLGKIAMWEAEPSGTRDHYRKMIDAGVKLPE